jgi:hypothetical protein
MLKGLTDQRAGWRTSTLASKDLRKQLMTLLPSNAPHENDIGTMAVEVPLYHGVSLSQWHYMLSGYMIFRKDVVF